MAISKEDIFRAADELDAAGKSPTLSAVRKAVGGGSFTTISDTMTEWKARKAAKEATAHVPPPPAVAERLQAFGAELWALALDIANGRLDAEREALAVERSHLEAEKAEATEAADQIGADLDAANARIAALEASLKEKNAEVGAAKEELASISERAIRAEVKAEEAGKRADDLNAQLQIAHDQCSELMRMLRKDLDDESVVAQ